MKWLYGPPGGSTGTIGVDVYCKSRCLSSRGCASFKQYEYLNPYTATVYTCGGDLATRVNASCLFFLLGGGCRGVMESGDAGDTLTRSYLGSIYDTIEVR